MAIQVKSKQGHKLIASVEGQVTVGQAIFSQVDNARWRIVSVNPSTGEAAAEPERGSGGRPAVCG